MRDTRSFKAGLIHTKFWAADLRPTFYNDLDAIPLTGIAKQPADLSLGSSIKQLPAWSIIWMLASPSDPT